MNSGLRPRPLSALWGEERKEGPQVKICLLRFCEDLFVCLFSFVGTDVFTSFQYAESEKEKKVPFDFIVYCVVQKCQKTVPLLFIYEIIHFYSMSMLCMISTFLLFDMFPHLKLVG